VAEVFGQNLVCGLGPLEGLRSFVVQVDEGTDVGLSAPDRSVNTSLDLLCLSRGPEGGGDEYPARQRPLLGLLMNFAVLCSIGDSSPKNERGFETAPV
jgi:hypothetical protein